VTPLSELARQSIELEGLSTIIYGLILIGIVLYSPRGVVSWPRRAYELLADPPDSREEGVTPDGDD
jgi:branched-chain amino acid transport system permease protein